MSFIGTSVSTSPTFAGIAAADIQNGAGRAVKFDVNGAVVPCETAGEAALGILILQTSDDVKAGDSVTVQISCIGRAKAGQAAIAAGALAAVDDTGTFATAEAGDFVFGQALKATPAGGYFDMQITKSGKLPTA